MLIVVASLAVIFFVLFVIFLLLPDRSSSAFAASMSAVLLILMVSVATSNNSSFFQELYDRVDLLLNGGGRSSSGPRVVTGDPEQSSSKLDFLVEECLNQEKCTSVNVFYGSSRERSADRSIEIVGTGLVEVDPFTDDASLGLNLGKVAVSVPIYDGRFGQLPRPTRVNAFGWSIGKSLEPSKHFVLYGHEIFTEEEFSSKIGESGGMFVFIHGFRTSFKSAAFRAAQIKVDSGYKGDAAIFSWPAESSVTNYDTARDNAVATRDKLRDFLLLLKNEMNGKPIHIIAHSMGNFALLPVLEEMVLSQESEASGFSELMFAAPDISRNEFRRITQFLNSQKVSEGMTLYASATDLAMVASRRFCDTFAPAAFDCSPRAGDVPEDVPVLSDGVDSIDVSNLDRRIFDLDFLEFGHNYYGAERTIVQDIGLLLNESMRPPKRRNSTLRIEVDDTSGREWWRVP